MNRSDAMTYLRSEFGELATESSLDASVLDTAYSTAIDQACRGLEVPESGLAAAVISDNHVVGFLALLDYFALTRYARVFALRTDVNVSGAIQASQSQTYKQVQALLDKAEKKLNGLGLSPAEEMKMGRFTLDFLEPAPGEF